jgi:hypothetical protein
MSAGWFSNRMHVARLGRVGGHEVLPSEDHDALRLLADHLVLHFPGPAALREREDRRGRRTRRAELGARCEGPVEADPAVRGDPDPAIALAVERDGEGQRYRERLPVRQGRAVVEHLLLPERRIEQRGGVWANGRQSPTPGSERLTTEMSRWTPAAAR